MFQILNIINSEKKNCCRLILIAVDFVGTVQLLHLMEEYYVDLSNNQNNSLRDLFHRIYSSSCCPDVSNCTNSPVTYRG